MSHITVCDSCAKNLTGTYKKGFYHRQRYITLITHKCESRYNTKEVDPPDKHFCREGCLKTYYSKRTFTTGDGGGSTTRSTRGGGSTVRSTKEEE